MGGTSLELALDRKKCDSCLACLRECPAGLHSLNAMKCTHCNPRDAACVAACENGALYEIACGVISIDKALCSGCGKCAEACPLGAVEMIGKRAAKCDLCAAQGFLMQCMEKCGRQAISVAKPGNEAEEVEKMLGWRVLKHSGSAAAHTIESSESHEIAKLEGGEKIYCLRGFPELTIQEAALIREVTEQFRENSPGSKKTDMEKTLADYCRKKLIELDSEQHTYLLEIVELLVSGFGPISRLLEDDNIEEIAVIGTGRAKPLYVYERKFGWLKTNTYFSSEETLRNIINKMSRKIGRRLTLQTPKLNAVLPDGSRLNACIPPVSFLGPSATIRKFRKTPFTPLSLIGNRTVSAEAMALLWAAMQTDCSILICGNTGSGKTSLLNALFYLLPKEERIIITEETPEISLPHSHIVKLNTAEELKIGMHSLITDSLRMRPDRMIVGEVRSREEVAAFIDTLLAGQGKGCYATFHAQSAEEAVTRLKSMGAMEMDILSIDLIIAQKRWSRINIKKGSREEVRRVVEIAELLEKGGRLKLNSLFSFNYRKDRLEKTNSPERLLGKMMRTYSLDRNELEAEIRRKEAEIERLAAKQLGPSEFFDYANRRL